MTNIRPQIHTNCQFRESTAKIMSLDKRLYILVQYPDYPCVGCVDSHRLDSLLSDILQVKRYMYIMLLAISQQYYLMYAHRGCLTMR